MYQDNFIRLVSAKKRVYVELNVRLLDFPKPVHIKLKSQDQILGEQKKLY